MEFESNETTFQSRKLVSKCRLQIANSRPTVYPKKYAHGFVVLCFVVVTQSFIRNSHEVFIHIHQGCFAGTGAIVRLPQCQWSKPDGYGKISQCITTTKHSKAKTVCIFLGIYCKWTLIFVYNPLLFNVSALFPCNSQESTRKYKGLYRRTIKDGYKAHCVALHCWMICSPVSYISGHLSIRNGLQWMLFGKKKNSLLLSFESLLKWAVMKIT